MRPTGLLLRRRRRWLRYEFYNGLHCFPSCGRRTVCGKSLDHRHHGHAGNLMELLDTAIANVSLPHMDEVSFERQGTEVRMRKASGPKQENPVWRPHDRIARRLVSRPSPGVRVFELRQRDRA